MSTGIILIILLLLLGLAGSLGVLVAVPFLFVVAGRGISL